MVSPPPPTARRRTTPRNAEGMEPIISHFTSCLFTVPCRRWTPPPTGFMTTAATRSLDTAARGWILNSSTRMGVISAPPPIPVSPTVKPTIRPASAMYQSMCMPVSLYLHYVGGDSREVRCEPVEPQEIAARWTVSPSATTDRGRFDAGRSNVPPPGQPAERSQRDHGG